MTKLKPSQKTIYLDHAATTPIREEVLRVMKPYFAEKFGNPSSLYKLGVEAKNAIETARKSIAENLNARAEEIVFTAGGSESVNLGILGVAKNHKARQPLSNSPLTRGENRKRTHGHIITSKIEHHAVLNTVEQLEKEGFAVTQISVDDEGFFDIEEFKKAIRPDTFLVSLMYANNEIGTVEPIREISKIIKQENLRRFQLKTKNSQLETPVLLHTDACQAAGFLDLNVQRLGVDLMSINASKIYGPKQIGCLYAKKGIALSPIIFGGGQERNLRSGTENVAGIVGFAKALELAALERDKEILRLNKLRDYLFKEIMKINKNAVLNGPSIANTTSPLTPLLRRRGETGHRLPNNLNITFPNAEGEALMLYLDAHNIAVSTGSACTAYETDPSHVLKAIGLSDEDAKSSLRITLGKSTNKKDLEYFIKALKETLKVVSKNTVA